MNEFFDQLADNLKDAFWTGVGRKSEDPQSKKPKWWLVLCVRLGFLAILAAIAEEALRWLKTTITEHPLEISFVLLVAISSLFLEMWIRWMRDAKFAWNKALEFERRIEGLELQITTGEQKCARLETELATLRIPANSLTQHQGRTFRCILCAGQITLPNIVTEVGFDHHIVKEAVHALRHDLSLVRRAGRNANNEELFALSDQGKQFAAEHRIPAIDQGDQMIQQTAADAEKKALEEQNTLLFQQTKTAADRITDLEAMVSNLQKKLPPPRAVNPLVEARKKATYGWTSASATPPAGK